MALDRTGDGLNRGEARVFVVEGTAAFQAWRAWHLDTMTAMIGIERHKGARGIWKPAEWPPSIETPAERSDRLRQRNAVLALGFFSAFAFLLHAAAPALAAAAGQSPRASFAGDIAFVACCVAFALIVWLLWWWLSPPRPADADSAQWRVRRVNALTNETEWVGDPGHYDWAARARRYLMHHWAGRPVEFILERVDEAAVQGAHS